MHSNKYSQKKRSYHYSVVECQDAFIGLNIVLSPASVVEEMVKVSKDVSDKFKIFQYASIYVGCLECSNQRQEILGPFRPFTQAFKNHSFDRSFVLSLRVGR